MGSTSDRAVWQRVADVRVHSCGFVSTVTGVSIIGCFVSYFYPQTNAFIPTDYFDECTTSMILLPTKNEFCHLLFTLGIRLYY